MHGHVVKLSMLLIMMLIMMLYVYYCEVDYGVDYVAKMFHEVEVQDAK